MSDKNKDHLAGKRYKISTNLRVKPVERNAPKPISIEDYRSADVEAALVKFGATVKRR